MSEDQFLSIQLSEIIRSPFSIREGSDLTEITKSIEENGVIEPVIVRSKDGKYELVAGERRFSASKAAGLKEIPAVVRALTDEQAFIIQSCENLHRADLSDSEKTALVTFYAEHFQKKPKEIAKLLGMSYDWVLKYLPGRFKNQVKAASGSLGGSITQHKVLDSVNQTVKTQDVESTPTPQTQVNTRIQCSRCHVWTLFPQTLPDGKVVCKLCYEFAEKPETPKPEVQTPEPQKETAAEPDIEEAPVTFTATCPVCKENIRLIHNSEGDHDIDLSQT